MDWTSVPECGFRRPHPAGVITLLRGVVAGTGGRSNGYALRSDGTVWVWGSNSAGLSGVTALGVAELAGYAVR